MAKLSINTSLDSVVICGEFCGWNIDKALRVDRVYKKDVPEKQIHLRNMPKGEYRVFSSKSFVGGEIYPTDRRQMPNRYFSGEADEVITCYF